MSVSKSNLLPKVIGGKEIKVFGAAITLTAALGACALPGPGQEGGCEEPPEPYPLLEGERVAWVRVNTVPECRNVRLLSSVIAGPPALVEHLGGQAINKEGPAPQISSVSYEPGFSTQMEVRAFLTDPPAEDETVTLSCEVYSDGQILPGAEDVEYVDESNQQTAFVLCVFNENLAPPMPVAAN